MRAFISKSDVVLARATTQTIMQPKPKSMTGSTQLVPQPEVSQQKAVVGGPTVIETSDSHVQFLMSTQPSGSLSTPSYCSMGGMYMFGYFQAGSMAFQGYPTAGFTVEDTTVGSASHQIRLSYFRLELPSLRLKFPALERLSLELPPCRFGPMIFQAANLQKLHDQGIFQLNCIIKSLNSDRVGL
jgi:hypothetical protein